MNKFASTFISVRLLSPGTLYGAVVRPSQGLLLGTILAAAILSASAALAWRGASSAVAGGVELELQ